MHWIAFQEAVVQRCSTANVLSEISQNLQENTCPRVPFLIKLQARSATLFKKETLVQVFPVNFAKFLRTPFSAEHLWTTASAVHYKIFKMSKVTLSISGIRCTFSFTTRLIASRFRWRIYSLFSLLFTHSRLMMWYNDAMMINIMCRYISISFSGCCCCDCSACIHEQECFFSIS